MPHKWAFVDPTTFATILDYHWLHHGDVWVCDNKFSIQLAENPTSSEMSKRIDIDCHFIMQYVASGFLKLI